MNQLLRGVDSDFPDNVSGTLVRGNHARQLCLELNSAATLLAVGCSDGVVAMSVTHSSQPMYAACCTKQTHERCFKSTYSRSVSCVCVPAAGV